VSNLAIMGGNDVQLGDEVVPPGGPVIRIRLVSIMGGCSVKRGRKLSKEERRRQKELRESDRRGELEADRPDELGAGQRPGLEAESRGEPDA
jgi:hypothetical protein